MGLPMCLATGGLMQYSQPFEGEVLYHHRRSGITEGGSSSRAAARLQGHVKSDEFGGKPWHVQLEFMKRQPRHTLLG